MRDFWKTVKLGLYVFALPLVATAAASAHQWMTDSQSLSVPELPAAVNITDGQGASTLRHHTINLDQDGKVHGRVVNIDQATRSAIGLGNLKVHFVKNGEVVKQVKTVANGSFTVEGLAEGPYSFIATGESGFAAYGVNVVSSNESKVSVMEAAAVSPRFIAVKEILENRVPAVISKEIMDLAKTEKTNLDIQGANRVQLVGGKLTGNIVPIWGKSTSVSGTYVHVVRDDKEVASVAVNASGEFTIENLQPGVYDFVAAGQSGFAAVSFEAVASSNGVDTDAIPASANPQDMVADGFAAPTLDVGLTAPMDNGIVGDSIGYACDTCGGTPAIDYASQPIEYVGEAVGCGCAAGGSCGAAANFGGYGGCCGGGGGFGGGGGGLGLLGGGGGGLGRLLQLAGLTTAIVALADDDDDTAPPPISPF